MHRWMLAARAKGLKRVLRAVALRTLELAVVLGTPLEVRAGAQSR
jgi:hypothetical protein